MTPFSLRIFVADGDPDGLRIFEKSNWIGKALVFPWALLPQVIAQTRKDSRGRSRKRRTVVVLDNRYVVVLEPCPSAEDRNQLMFITAFPADQAYLDRVRRGAQVVERRAQK